MKSIISYIFRWNETNRWYFISNILFAAVICSVTCYVSCSQVFIDYSSTRACLFAILMASIWSGLFNTITRFFSESHYIVDDLQKLFPVSTYMIANLLIQCALCAMEALCITYIFWELRNYAGVTQEGLWLTTSINIEYFIGFFLIILSADILGFFVGIAVEKINTLMSFVPFLLIIQFLFSGCLFKLNGFSKVLSNAATAKYGLAILGIESNLNELAVYEALKDDIFTYTSSNLFHYWKCLAVLSAVFFALAWISMSYKVNKQEV